MIASFHSEFMLKLKEGTMNSQKNSKFDEKTRREKDRSSRVQENLAMSEKEPDRSYSICFDASRETNRLKRRESDKRVIGFLCDGTFF